MPDTAGARSGHLTHKKEKRCCYSASPDPSSNEPLGVRKTPPAALIVQHSTGKSAGKRCSLCSSTTDRKSEADCFSCHMSARPEHSVMQTVCSALAVFSCPCNHNEILVCTPNPGGCWTMSKVSTSKSESMDLSWKRVECRLQPGNELLPHEEECKSYRVFVHQWGDRGGTRTARECKREC